MRWLFISLLLGIGGCSIPNLNPDCSWEVGYIHPHTPIIRGGDIWPGKKAWPYEYVFLGDPEHNYFHDESNRCPHPKQGITWVRKAPDEPRCDPIFSSSRATGARIIRKEVYKTDDSGNRTGRPIRIIEEREK